MTEMDKRQAILKAGEEIFAQKGLKDSTITEIAQRAGVVDSIIYHYFENKEDLLFHTFDENMKNSYKELMFHFQGLLGPMSKLGKMIWYHLYSNDYNTSHERIVKSLLLECRSNKNFYKHKSFDSLRKYTYVMLEIINSGIETGCFRKDISAVLAREMVFGLLDEVSLSRLQSDVDSRTIADFDAIMSLVLAMIEYKPNTKPVASDKSIRILKGATRVFAKEGFSKATMVDVGNAAGVAEGTIYEYYKNKHDLLFSIPMERFQFYLSCMDECLRNQGPLARLKSLIWLHFCIFSSDSDFVTVFLNDIKLNRLFYVSDSYRNYLDYIKPLFQILDEGKASGVFRPEVDNRIYRHLFIGSFTHMAIRWFLRGKSTPLGMMNEFGQMAEMLCRAVVP